ncbi:hypothetical protein ACTXT7_000694 [Hymenolepis weldensis]
MYDGRKSWEDSPRHLAKDHQVSERTIRNVVHQDLGYVLRRDEMMSTQTAQENDHDEKSIEEMIGGYVWADPTEIPITTIHTKVSPIMIFLGVVRSEERITTSQFVPRGLRANTNTHVDTSRTIVKPP